MRPVYLREGRLVERSGRFYYSRKTGSQSITSGAFETVNGFVVAHPGGFVTTASSVTAIYPGVYHVRAWLVHNTSSPSTLVRLLKNGGVVPAVAATWHADTDGNGVAIFETVVDLDQGDTLELQARRNNGPSRQITDGFWMIAGD